MRLTDLSPRWLNVNVFVFRCPHCPDSGELLTCKNVPMNVHDQIELCLKTLGPYDKDIVPAKADTIWAFSSDDFATMSVTPSIDASNSGHWHGHITNGEIK